jgi:acetyl-CoA C-acetyltransferase
MTAPERTPVIAGVAQVEQREFDPENGKEPLDLMVDAVTAAAEDAGAKSLLHEASSVRVIWGFWPYQDPGRGVAERIGATAAETTLTSLSGSMVQTVVNISALEIASGQRDVVIVTGGECGRSSAKALKAGIELDWSHMEGQPDRVLGDSTPYLGEYEKALGMERAWQFYPFFENALRHQRGASIPDHQVYISELWERFNRVAVDNPHAWLRKPITAEEIRTPSTGNRWVTFPYPKLMNSNNQVDQGAALILCSLATAQRLGVPAEKLIFPQVGTDVFDHLCVSNRDNLYSSPGIRIGGNRALELAELDVSDLDFVDIYSCFPSAVQVAAAELGLSVEDNLTVTGGLTFAGGPHNNYVMHSIATMAELLRGQPGSTGLITANGGYLAKHAFGIYSTEPPANGFQFACPQNEVDATPRREVAGDVRGDVTVESYSIIFGNHGPQVAYLPCLTDDGRRTWAKTNDAATMTAMMEEEFCGKSARVDGKGGIEFP